MVENSKNLISSNRLFPDMTENLCLKEKPVCKYHGGTYIHIYHFILMIPRIFKRKKLHKFFNRYVDLKNFFFDFFSRTLEVIVVVLSDILFFLQETNQKYSFIHLENKPNTLAVQR